MSQSQATVMEKRGQMTERLKGQKGQDSVAHCTWEHHQLGLRSDSEPDPVSSERCMTREVSR